MTRQPNIAPIIYERIINTAFPTFYFALVEPSLIATAKVTAGLK